MNKAIKILIIVIVVSLISVITACSFDLDLSWRITQRSTDKEAEETTPEAWEITPEVEKITQEDFNREASRWWVIYYKMLEDEIPGQTTELVTGTGGVEETLENEFGINFTKCINGAEPNLKEQYYYMKRRNELMEEALVKLKGDEALKEIEGI